MAQKALAPGSIIAGRYRIVREIGRGGMGAVYVVEHVNTGGQWALKVMLSGHLDYQKAARFKREARASAKVSSQYVVKVTDADTAPELNDAPFLVMELLEGEDLEQRLAKNGPLPPAEVIEIMTQVARGLDRAHSVGVIHRDLKPDNVFLHRREDGTTIVKLLDFGISKLLADDEATSVTKTSDIFGTPLYMSPEQAGGKHDAVGPATDVWALGLLTFRILTGQIYWTGETVPTLVLQIVSPERDLPSVRYPKLGPAFDRWFLKSIAGRPSERFQSVGEQVAALTAALSAQPTDEGTLLLTPPGGHPAPFSSVSSVSHAMAATPMPTPSPSASISLGGLRPPNPPTASGAPLRSAPSTSRLPGASTDGPLVTSPPPPPRRGRGLAFFGVAVTGVFIAGLVYVMVLAAQPETHATHPATTSAPTTAIALAPDAAPVTSATIAVAPPAVTVDAGPSIAKPAMKTRPGGKPRPASSQTDHFDTQK